jgi:hypothetical protein
MENTTENVKDIILNDDNLSQDCKKVVKKVSYNSLLDLQTSIQNYDKVTFMDLFDIISTVMIFVENIEMGEKTLSGDTKKNLVLFLSRFLITTYIKDKEFIKLYEQNASDIIEKIIYSSVFLNVQNIANTKCCNIF